MKSKGRNEVNWARTAKSNGRLRGHLSSYSQVWGKVMFWFSVRPFFSCTQKLNATHRRLNTTITICTLTLECCQSHLSPWSVHIKSLLGSCNNRLVAPRFFDESYKNQSLDPHFCFIWAVITPSSNRLVAYQTLQDVGLNWLRVCNRLVEVGKGLERVHSWNR